MRVRRTKIDDYVRNRVKRATTFNPFCREMCDLSLMFFIDFQLCFFRYICNIVSEVDILSILFLHRNGSAEIFIF